MGENQVLQSGHEKIFIFSGEQQKEGTKEELRRLKAETREKMMQKLNKCIDNDYPFLLILSDKQNPDLTDYVGYANILNAVDSYLILYHSDKAAENAAMATLQNAVNIRMIGG